MCSSSKMRHPRLVRTRHLLQGSRVYRSASSWSQSCPFFLWKNCTVSKSKRQEWKDRAEKNVATLPTFEDVVSDIGINDNAFYFCHTCSELTTAGKLQPKHSGHLTTKKLSKPELQSPTSLLSARSESKHEAQFHFSERTVETIVKNLKAVGLSRIICIGAPKIHEKVRASDELESILLDFDPRLSQFFSKEEFCRYNMFNHHFFGGREGKQVRSWGRKFLMKWGLI